MPAPKNKYPFAFKFALQPVIVATPSLPIVPTIPDTIHECPFEASSLVHLISTVQSSILQLRLVDPINEQFKLLTLALDKVILDIVELVAPVAKKYAEHHLEVLSLLLF